MDIKFTDKGTFLGKVEVNKEPLKLSGDLSVQTGAKEQETIEPLPNLDHILQLRLFELSKRNIAIKIYSEVLGCEIWLCGTEEMANQLGQDDPETTVYTANEMKRLMSLNPDPQGLINIHIAKTVFPGSKMADSKLKERN